MKSCLRVVSVVLIPALILLAFPGGAAGQDGSEINPVVPSSGSSGGDDTAQAILIGLFVAIVAVVFILGFKSDFGRSKGRQRAELEKTYEEFVKDGDLPTAAYAAPTLEPVAFDVARYEPSR